MAFDVVMSVFNQCFLNKLALAAVEKAKIFLFDNMFLFIAFVCGPGQRGIQMGSFINLSQ